MACNNEMQEKFQTTAPPGPDATNQWTSFKDQRVIAKCDYSNEMPPGYDALKEQGNRDSFRGITLAGKTDEQNQREGSLNDNTLRNGFYRSAMSPTEDQYTDEHKDDFYDDVGGFVERANYLDRL